jgi:hypothetical protein
MRRRPFIVGVVAASLAGCSGSNTFFSTLLQGGLNQAGGMVDCVPLSPPYPYIQSALDAYFETSSAPAGSTINLHIRCQLSTYQNVAINIYKLHDVWKNSPPYPTGPGSPSIFNFTGTATVQLGASNNNPTADQAQATGGCTGWASVPFHIPSSWSSDLYVAQVQSVNDSQAFTFVPFIIRPSFAALGTRPIAIVLPEYTYQAYNPWGNASLYICRPDGQAPFSKISFNRPYAGTPGGPKSSGTNRFSDADSYIRDFLTNNNFGSTFQADFFLSSDLETNPSALSYYNMFISIFHDEYWTDQVWNAYNAAILNLNHIKGVNAAFLGGNTGFWKPKWISSTRQLQITKIQLGPNGPWPPTDWKHAPDMSNTGLWWNGVAPDSQHPLPSYVPGMWIGGGPMGGSTYTKDDQPNAYTVNQSHWVFTGQGVVNGQNTGLSPGGSFGQATGYHSIIGWESDAIQFNVVGGAAVATGNDGAGSLYPGTTRILAYASLTNWNENSYIGTSCCRPTMVAQATVSILEPNVTSPIGSVFMAGSIDWMDYGLSPYAPYLAGSVGQITANVLNKFSR